MDLNLSKELLKYPRGSTRYLDGVRMFLDFAFASSEYVYDGKIFCPCVECVNIRIHNRNTVYGHLVCNGMLEGYSDWNLHGEGMGETSSRAGRNECPRDTSNFMFVDTDQLIHDVFDGVGGDNFGTNSPNSMETNVPQPNLDAENFYHLLKEMDQVLWEGCELTKLSFLILLLNTKTTNKWSDKSVSDLLSILQLAIPNGKSLPESYPQLKKLLKKLGLSYEKIDACPNHCQLYWKETAKDEACSVCGASRWKSVEQAVTSSGPKKKKGISAKVLRYFPLKPRLKRLFMCKQTAPLLRWHEEERTKDGALRHPADSEAWKDFDAKHVQFSSEPRNVRLGLASDGFNPFGMLSTQISCWPVVLVLYNLPPWLCMKPPYLFLSTLIPGPKQPGQKIDVYLKPLIEELKELWDEGMITYDASLNENFRLFAALLWTISDYPGYSYLSGYSVQSQFGCPHCNVETWSLRLPSGGKYCFMGHRRFLDCDHPYRFDKDSFDGTEEFRSAPIMPSGSVVLSQIEELSNRNFKDSKTWKKKSILFSLPYWEFNLLRHNIDNMHTEKNVAENTCYTIIGQQDKTKDNLKARFDLEHLGIRKELHAKEQMSTSKNKKYYIPPACYVMSPEEKKKFCNVLRHIKVPDGYAGNISRYVNEAQSKLIGLKTHDLHILIQQLLPIAVRGLLPNNVINVLLELSSYFRELCSKVLYLNKLKQLEEKIKLTLCHLEMIFPPGFFTIMVHLTIHLVQEAMIAGPVQLRWMYPIERYLGVLKSYVRNRARPEGSIAEAYLADECMIFCSRYINGFDTKLNQISRNGDNAKQMMPSTLEPSCKLFEQRGQPLGKCGTYLMTSLELAQAHRYVLFNCDAVIPYLKLHATEIKRNHRNRRLQTKDIESIQHKTFHNWFRDYVMNLELKGQIESISKDLAWLAKWPIEVARAYRGFNINGYRFRPARYDKATQNSGVVLVAKTSSYTGANDRNPVLGDLTYYGRIKEIVELDYNGQFGVVLFKCDWVDVTRGRGIKKDDYGITSVDFSHLIHSGDKLEDEPFIFASQANQVFYVQDPSCPEWSAAVGLKPRDVYDMGSEDALEGVEHESYHASFLEYQSWVRSDVEGTIIEVEETHQLRRTNSF